MRPLSSDLRERIVAAVEQGEHSLRELAGLFVVNLSAIVRLLQRYRRTGSVQPKPHAGGPAPALDAKAEGAPRSGLVWAPADSLSLMVVLLPLT
jgi:transposase